MVVMTASKTRRCCSGLSPRVGLVIRLASMEADRPKEGCQTSRGSSRVRKRRDFAGSPVLLDRRYNVESSAAADRLTNGVEAFQMVGWLDSSRATQVVPCSRPGVASCSGSSAGTTVILVVDRASRLDVPALVQGHPNGLRSHLPDRRDHAVAARVRSYDMDTIFC